jgi:flavorubredoxin
MKKRAFRQIKAIADQHGYTFDGKTANQHLRWVHPTKPMVITISKESDTRSIKNVAACFRRVASNQAGNDVRPV